jgi:hypothetical protein
MIKRMNTFIFYLFCLLLAWPMTYYFKGQIKYFYKPHETIFEKFLRLDNTFLKSLIYINQLPQKQLFLTFSQSVMYKYTKVPFISYLDRRLLPVYQAKTKQEVYDLLKAMNIKYVDTLSTDPVLINSQLIEMLNDPKYAELNYQSGTRIFLLNDKVRDISSKFIKLDNNDIATDSFGKRKLTKKNKFFSHPKTLFTSDLIQTALENNKGFHQNDIFQVKWAVSGMGLYQVKLHEYNSNQTLIKSSVIFEDVLNQNQKTRHAQFLLAPQTQYFRLSCELSGVGKLKLDNIFLRSIPKIIQPTQWTLFLAELFEDNTFTIKKSENQFLLHEEGHGFSIGDFSMKIPLIVSEGFFNHNTRIDFDVQGKGCFNVLLIKNEEVFKKVTKNAICLNEHAQHLHFENLAKQDAYQLGIYFSNLKKDNRIQLQNFKSY